MNLRLAQVWHCAALLVAATALLPPPARAAALAQTLAQIDQVFQAGEADKALQQIGSLPQAGADSAEVQNLSCRIHYALQQWDKAVSECEKSTRLDNQNAIYHMWLGRALGQKAAHASVFSAYSIAKRTAAEFETAARLNPRNADVLLDLGEYYRSAPGFVGGGLDKAERVAVQLDGIEASRGHQLHAHIAEARGDYDTAEREYKQAVATSPHPALRWTVLASFYRIRKRYTDMQAALRNAEGLARKDPRATVALYDGAGVLIDGKLDPGTAARLLEEYLSCSTKTEEGPAFEGYVRLAKMQKELGDKAAAQQQIAAALALAHDYRPALEFNR